MIKDKDIVWIGGNVDVGITVSANIVELIPEKSKRSATDINSVISAHEK